MQLPMAFSSSSSFVASGEVMLMASLGAVLMEKVAPKKSKGDDSTGQDARME